MRIHTAFLMVACALVSISSPALALENDREVGQFKPLPNYPRQAALDCIQGTVVARFVVSDEHTPEQIEIIHARPEGVFDQVVIDALSRWVVDAQPGDELEEDFDFTIDGCD